jgi:hypothetical protein
MEPISTILTEVVKKIGGTTLAFLVVIVALIGGAVYSFEVYTKSAEPTPTGNKTVEIKNQGGTDATQNLGNISL